MCFPFQLRPKKCLVQMPGKSRQKLYFYNRGSCIDDTNNITYHVSHTTQTAGEALEWGKTPTFSMSSSGRDDDMDKEINLVETSLGITRLSHDSGDAIEVETTNVTESTHRLAVEQAEEEKQLTRADETVEDLDLSGLRGIQPPPEEEQGVMTIGGRGGTTHHANPQKSQELEGLSELLPAVKDGTGTLVLSPSHEEKSPEDERKIHNIDSMQVDSGIDKVDSKEGGRAYTPFGVEGISEGSDESSSSANTEDEEAVASILNPELHENKGILDESSSDSTAVKTHSSGNYQDSKQQTSKPFLKANEAYQTVSPYSSKIGHENDDGSKNSGSGGHGTPTSPKQGEFQDQSSAVSLSTATQSHEVRMPMYLPTFRPATGCTNASDFIVRCFVARLRSGITVVKHGRSRWCKSRLRILHVHSDGRSLSWRPAQGEPTSSKRPPKLDLSTCIEVRHAWSPDPLNPMFTGTPILRVKCEPANAFKSFALIFQRRTVDITAVTADQCKVLMEGFSALCFRLQVANMAGRERNSVGIQNGQTNGSKDPTSPEEVSAN